MKFYDVAIKDSRLRRESEEYVCCVMLLCAHNRTTYIMKSPEPHERLSKLHVSIFMFDFLLRPLLVHLDAAHACMHEVIIKWPRIVYPKNEVYYILLFFFFFFITSFYGSPDVRSTEYGCFDAKMKIPFNNASFIWVLGNAQLFYWTFNVSFICSSSQLIALSIYRLPFYIYMFH